MPNVPVAVLPCVSIALQLTVVVPIGKREPEGGEHTGVTFPSTTSKADRYLEYETAVVLLVAFTAKSSAGRLRAGEVVSPTTILNDFVTDLPLLLILPELLLLPSPLLLGLSLSLTEQITVVTPTGKREPEGGEHTGER